VGAAARTADTVVRMLPGVDAEIVAWRWSTPLS
jgi:hypothetical protein